MVRKIEEILEEIEEIDTLHDEMTKIVSERKDFDTNLPIQVPVVVDT